MNKFSNLFTKISRLGQTVGKDMTEREYFEWVNPYLRSFFHPLGVLFVLEVASIICGILVAPQGFIVSASVLAVIIVGCIWPWIGMRGVSCQLRFTAMRGEEGKPIEAELIVINRWPWPVWGLAVEGGFEPAGEEGEETEMAISRIGGWSRGNYSWSFTPKVRGKYPLTSPQLVTEFPFGLWKARKPIEVQSRLIVWPHRFPLPQFPIPAGAPSWVGQSSENAAGVVGHRTTVREYRQGDSMRQIHWAKTALYDKLVSYDREGLAVSDATITLDTQSDLHPERGPDSTLEWTIRIAASVGDTLLRQGIGVTLLSHSSQFSSLTDGSNPAGMLDWLAALNTDDIESNRRRISPNLSNPQNISVHITTDLSETTSGDSIVLRTDIEQPTEDRDGNTKGGWIIVEKDSDIPNQIRKGWRDGPRRVHYAI